MAYTFAGKGYKRTQLNLSIKRIKLNPMPLRFEGVNLNDQDEAVRFYLENGELQPLLHSLSKHGYFDEEPIVAVPVSLPEKIKSLPEEELMWSEDYVLHIHNPNNHFIVIEGNRRIAAAIALMKGDSVFPGFDIPDVPEDILFDLSVIPSIIYTSEKEVLPYLYVRHTDFQKKWSDKEISSFQSRMDSFGHSKEYIDQFKS